MSTEDHKAIARRYYEEWLNEKKLGVADDLFAPNYVAHFAGTPGPLDRKAYHEFTVSFFSSFPDAHFEIQDQIAQDDQVVSRGIMLRTEQGISPAGLGNPPKLERVERLGITIHRIANGKIVEQWTPFDDTPRFKPSDEPSA